MKDQLELIQEIDELNSEIKKHDLAYYKTLKPTIPDSEYDAKIVKLRELVDQLDDSSVVRTVLDEPASDIQDVVWSMDHERPMLSIRTEVDTSQTPIEKFHERVCRLLKTTDVEYIAEPKYDGLAVSLRYSLKHGVPTLAFCLTRGDGTAGEDISGNVIHVSNVPVRLQDGIQLGKITEIRGELLLPKNCLKEINEYRVKIGKPEFVNCRNAIAGIVRQKEPDVELLKRAVFMPYAVFQSEPTIGFQSVALAVLAQVCPNPFKINPVRYIGDYKGLFAAYQELELQRDSLDFEIDGIVYKVNDIKLQGKLGVSGREPKWAIAHKFRPQEAKTTLQSIDIQVGPSGRITPMARLEPVFVGGTTVTNVTLSNFDQIRQKDIAPGDVVYVRRAGDVTPEIMGRASERSGPVPEILAPDHCPCCGTPVTRREGEVNYYCPNTYGCAAQIAGGIERICSRKYLNIQGIGEVVAKMIQESGKVKNPLDLFTLGLDDFKDLGLGDLTASKIMVNLYTVLSTPLPFNKFLEILGIFGIGERASLKIAEQVGSLDGLIAALGSLEDLKGITVAHVRDIREFFTRTQVPTVLSNRPMTMIDFLRELIQRFKIVNYEPNVDAILGNKTIVLTGSTPGIDRNNFKKKCQQLGAVIGSSVSKNTSVVVYGDGAGDKYDKAVKLKIPTLTYEEFIAQFPESNPNKEELCLTLKQI
jgi:DNA ligase (NAD+)